MSIIHYLDFDSGCSRLDRHQQFQNNQSNNQSNVLYVLLRLSQGLDVKRRCLCQYFSSHRWGDPEGWRFITELSRGSDSDSYLLEKMDLYKTDVELVEGEQMTDVFSHFD